MTRALSQLATFTFRDVTLCATSVSVDAPVAEVVNMTPIDAPAGTMKMIWTGDYTSPGKINVETYGLENPKEIVGMKGTAIFSTTINTITCTCVCDSVTASGQVGDLLRLKLSLTVTDYPQE